MSRSSIGTVTSAVLIFAAGVVLWPPRAVYWDVLGDVVGSGVVVLAVLGLCLVFGYLVARLTSIDLAQFALGAVIAYAAGMALLEVVVSPESPVHLLLYGLMASAMVLGFAIREARPPSDDRPSGMLVGAIRR